MTLKLFGGVCDMHAHSVDAACRLDSNLLRSQTGSQETKHFPFRPGEDRLAPNSIIPRSQLFMRRGEQPSSVAVS